MIFLHGNILSKQAMKKQNRRQFLKTTGLLAGVPVLVTPWATWYGSPKPDNRIGRETRFKMAWRVADRIWSDDAHFEGLTELLLRHGNTTDELTLMINEPSNSPYDPLERIKKLAGIFTRRAEVLRSSGKSVGINVWPSFGTGFEHEKSPLRPPIPFQRVTGMNGEEDPGIVCPVSTGFLDYTREKYTTLAEAGPDFIWLDDDIRFTDLFGVSFPCFCEHCVAGFLEGSFSSREVLVAQLNYPKHGDLRRQWSAYAADRLARYCSVARTAVDAVDPSIDTGFMAVGPTHTTYAGDFIEKCTRVLRSKRVRPGHGFYQDERPVDMLHKAMEVGRQTVRYPDHAVDIQYKEESWPDPILDKAVSTRINEVWLALAAGCNGVAFNHLPFSFLPADPGMLKTYRNELDELHRVRPAWDQYVAFAKGLPWQGFRTADNIFLMAGMDCSEKGWFREGDPASSIDKPQ